MAEESSSNSATLYFYGHHPNKDYAFMSQFYLVNFEAPSQTKPDVWLQFFCAEQYMMYRKAVLFEDHHNAERIMSKTAKDGPAEVKSLGRQVKGFDEELWIEHRESIVEDGNWYKFTRSRKGDLQNNLLATGNRELVEAAARDAIWGIGFPPDSAEQNRDRWGLNLLGKALMQVRQRIRDEVDSKDKAKAAASSPFK